MIIRCGKRSQTIGVVFVFSKPRFVNRLTRTAWSELYIEWLPRTHRICILEPKNVKPRLARNAQLLVSCNWSIGASAKLRQFIWYLLFQETRVHTEKHYELLFTSTCYLLWRLQPKYTFEEKLQLTYSDVVSFTVTSAASAEEKH